MLFLQVLSGQTAKTAKDSKRLSGPKNTQAAPKTLFNKIPSDLGLSQNVINCSLQDRIGFLWFGTKDGLNRFDGYGFKVYRHDPNDPGSLPDSNVTALFEDRQGRFWVGTENGLNLFDTAHESFSRIPEPGGQNLLSHGRINSVSEDREGAIWIATVRGVIKLVSAGPNDTSLTGAQFTHLKHEANNAGSLPETNISQVLPYNDELILVRTSNANLYTLDRNNNYAAKPFRIEGQESDKLILNLCLGRNGTIWLAASKGIYESNSTGISRFHSYRSSLLTQTVVNSIVEDHNGYVWLCGYLGLIRFDPRTEGFDFFPSGKTTQASGSESSDSSALEYGVNTILEDRRGALWFGSNGKGLFRYDRQIERFAHANVQSSKLSLWPGSSIRSLIELEDGTVLLSTTAIEFLRLDRRTGKVTPANVAPSDNFLTYSMLVDHTGALWRGGLGPLRRVEMKNGIAARVREYQLEPDAKTYPNGEIVNKIFEDHSGDIWVLTPYKLFHFDRAKDSFTGYLYNTTTDLPFDNYADICEDTTGSLWIGTIHGLLRFDRQNGTFKRYQHDPQNSASLSHNVVRTVVRDPSEPNVLWLGTAGGGLNRFDTQTETFSVLSEKDGLPNNVVYGILVDDEGNLWMSTNQGICRFNPRTRTFKTFDKKDGLQDNEFNSCAYFKSRSGELFFGGINGFNSFYPADVKDNSNPPAVVLTDFQILNKPVSFKTPDSPLAQSITGTKEITLNYDQRFFSFEFAALDFTEPSKNQYAYKLEGFDNAMIHVGTRRTAFYTNVPPGKYLFRVIASNNDGVWNIEGTVMQITVLPPFWRTWWFLTFATLLVITLVFFIYHRRLSQLKRQQEVQEVFARQLIEEQENDRKRIAAELHDGLGQTLLIIKNRAFLGSRVTEENGDSQGQESAHEQFDEISDSAAEALSQVREIAYDLRPSQLERLGLTSAIETMLERVAASSNIDFEAQLVPLDGVFPPEQEINFYRIVQESLNNIIKHSGATSARVVINKDHKGVNLLIHDNGKGFVYDENGSRKAGFGLKGMAERARILKGHYAIKSTPGGGTTIIVQIENRKRPE